MDDRRRRESLATRKRPDYRLIPDVFTSSPLANAPSSTPPAEAWSWRRRRARVILLARAVDGGSVCPFDDDARGVPFFLRALFALNKS